MTLMRIEHVSVCYNKLNYWDYSRYEECIVTQKIFLIMRNKIACNCLSMQNATSPSAFCQTTSFSLHKYLNPSSANVTKKTSIMSHSRMKFHQDRKKLLKQKSAFTRLPFDKYVTNMLPVFSKA